MFDIGWQELFIIAILAIIVVGPKDLPKALKTITLWLRKARSMAREFQSGVDDMVREAELEEFKKQAIGVGDDLRNDIEKTVDANGEVTKALDMSDVEKSFKSLESDVTEPAKGGDEGGKVAGGAS